MVSSFYVGGCCVSSLSMFLSLSQCRSEVALISARLSVPQSAVTFRRYEPALGW